MSFETRLSALIGTSTNAGVRVYQTMYTGQAAPALPYVIWQRITDSDERVQDADSPLRSALVQIMCFAKDATQAGNLRDQVEANVIGNHAAGPIAVSDRRDDFEPGPECFRADIDVTIWTNVLT